MIYTVTFNPSLDYVVSLPQLVPGEINRSEAEMIYPGGKGINVALVLGNLGIPAKMLGFIAGFSGKEIERLATVHGGYCKFISIENGYSRINMKICAAAEETAINGQGPKIERKHIEQLLKHLHVLQAGDVLVLAGSIPNTLPNDIYEQILQLLDGRHIKTVVDATGALVLNVLKYHPFLIKPNHHELSDMLEIECRTIEEITAGAKQLQRKGARNVLVSMAGAGAVLLTENGQIYQQLPPEGKLVNSVGAGDSMVAGFLAGYIASDNYRIALKTGICAGSASAFQPWLANQEDVDKLMATLDDSADI